MRDLSFSGSKLILVGLAKFLVGKDCLLRLEFHEPRETIDIAGKFVRYEDVEGRKDLAAIAVRFTDNGVPLSYKMHLNEYVGSIRKNDETPQGQGQGKTHSSLNKLPAAFNLIVCHGLMLFP